MTQQTAGSRVQPKDDGDTTIPLQSPTPVTPVPSHTGYTPVSSPVRSDAFLDRQSDNVRQTSASLENCSSAVGPLDNVQQLKAHVKILNEAIQRLPVSSGTQSDAGARSTSVPVSKQDPSTQPVCEKVGQARQRQQSSRRVTTCVSHFDDSDSDGGGDETSSSSDDSDRDPGSQRNGGRPVGSPPTPNEQQSAPQRVAAARSARPPYMKPDKFDGNVDVETFLCKFRNCSEFNQWTDADKGAFLRSSLHGEAAQLLWGSDNLTYDELVEKLKQRFGGKGMEARYQTELRCRRRRRNESLRELAQDVRRLLTLAYPGQTCELSEHLGRDAFLTALDDPELELKVRDHDPTDLEGAVKLAQRFEVSRDTVGMHSRTDRHCASRQVTNDGGPPFAAAPPASDIHELIEAAVNRSFAENIDRLGRTGSQVGANSSQTSLEAQPSISRVVESGRGPEPKASNDVPRRKRQSRAVAHQGPPQGCPQPPTVGQLPDNFMAVFEQMQQRVTELERRPKSQTAIAQQPSQYPAQWSDQRQGGGDRPRQLGPCWSCHGMGHLARDCPSMPWEAASYQPGQPGPNQSRVNRASSVASSPRDNYGAYLRAEVNGHGCDYCLLDTGSEVSLIPASLVRDDQITTSTEDVRAANGTVIRILGLSLIHI